MADLVPVGSGFYMDRVFRTLERSEEEVRAARNVARNRWSEVGVRGMRVPEARGPAAAVTEAGLRAWLAPRRLRRIKEEARGRMGWDEAGRLQWPTGQVGGEFR